MLPASPQAELAQDQDALGEEHVDILEGEQAQQQQGERPRITTRYMTKYEKARVLGTRALQIRCAAVLDTRPQRRRSAAGCSRVSSRSQLEL
jgi:hypothetical protein